MNSGVKEFVSQVLFFGSVAAFPGAVILIVFALRMKAAASLRRAVICLLCGVLLLSHFIWYVQYLGASLTLRTPTSGPAMWILQVPAVMLLAVVCLYPFLPAVRVAGRQ